MTSAMECEHRNAEATQRSEFYAGSYALVEHCADCRLSRIVVRSGTARGAGRWFRDGGSLTHAGRHGEKSAMEALENLMAELGAAERARSAQAEVAAS